jgi:hypothetical protein
MKPAFRLLAVAASLVAFAVSAHAALTAWDQAKVTELAKQLETTTQALSNSFRQQPAPTKGQPDRLTYHRLAQEVRFLRREARTLSRSLQRGADLEETLPGFESMLQTAGRAQANARRVSTVAQMHDLADQTRTILNQLGPYYQADFKPLAAPERR